MKKVLTAIGIFLSIGLIFLFFNPFPTAMFSFNFSPFNSPFSSSLGSIFNSLELDFLSGKNTAHSENPQPQDKEQNEKPQCNHNLVYVVKEYNGHIAIFEENSDTPFKITDVLLSELPDGDKKLLNKGIPASSSRELNCILEDYCS